MSNVDDLANKTIEERIGKENVHDPAAYWTDYADLTCSHTEDLEEEAERKSAFYAGIEAAYKYITHIVQSDLAPQGKEATVQAFRLRNRFLAFSLVVNLPKKAKKMMREVSKNEQQ